MQITDTVLNNVLNGIADQFDELAREPSTVPLGSIIECFESFRSKARRHLGLERGIAFLKATEPIHSVEPSNLEKRHALQRAIGAEIDPDREAGTLSMPASIEASKFLRF